MSMAVSERDLDELRSWAAGETDEVDWTAIELPPCTNAVREGANTTVRRARVVRAYYDPEVTVPQLDRERRIADAQTVIVAPDGSILATWQTSPEDLAQLRSTAPVRRPPRQRASTARRGPRDRDTLLRMLAAEGIHIERTSRHIRVHAPAGTVYIPSTPSDPRSVLNSVALLRRYGCTLRHSD